MKECGVYQITCVPNGQIYIGSTTRGFHTRWMQHLGHLKRGTHDSRYMRNCWAKYGPDAFEFKPLVICAKDMALFYEQLFIDALKPKFNTALVAGSALGVRHPPEVIQKFSRAQRGWRKKYEWRGKQMCLSDIAEAEGFDVTRLVSRVLGMGMSVEEALAKPYRAPVKMHEHDGRVMSQTDWAKELGMNPRRIHYWLAEGLTIGDCIARLNREAKRMSFREFCELSGAITTTAQARLRKGMSLMEAITAPTQITGARWRERQAA